jgi:calcium-dependent protein kinase
MVHITPEVKKRVGSAPLLGRYHKLPRRLQDDFTLAGMVLGEGCNGKVHMATRKGAPRQAQRYAVKALNIAKLPKKDVATLEAEVQIYLCMDHPHIARLINVYETPEHLNLVMECMGGGELFDRLQQVRQLGATVPEDQAADLTQQMLLVVHYLHSHGIVHRDLKLENFLFESSESNFLKLIDFGFSKFRNRDQRMRTACGTMAYVAPEVLQQQYTNQCDLWSLGIIVFVVLSGMMPFPQNGSSGDLASRIMRGAYFMQKEKWARISDEAMSFTKALLEKDPAIRLTAQDALRHPWIERNTQQRPLTFDPSVKLAFEQYSSAPKFRRCCLLAMAWLLTNQETAQIRKEFCAIDLDQQGTISFGELRSLMVEQFHVADDDILAIFRAMDITHSDEICYSEFVAAMLSTRIGLHDKLLDVAFRNFDQDLSGYITADDLRQTFGNTFEGDNVESLLQEATSSANGVSYSEFAAFVRGTPVNSECVHVGIPVHGQALMGSGHARDTAPKGCCCIM